MSGPLPTKQPVSTRKKTIPIPPCLLETENLHSFNSSCIDLNLGYDDSLVTWGRENFAGSCFSRQNCSKEKVMVADNSACAFLHPLISAPLGQQLDDVNRICFPTSASKCTQHVKLCFILPFSAPSPTVHRRNIRLPIALPFLCDYKTSINPWPPNGRTATRWHFTSSRSKWRWRRTHTSPSRFVCIVHIPRASGAAEERVW